MQKKEHGVLTDISALKTFGLLTGWFETSHSINCWIFARAYRFRKNVILFAYVIIMSGCLGLSELTLLRCWFKAFPNRVESILECTNFGWILRGARAVWELKRLEGFCFPGKDGGYQRWNGTLRRFLGMHIALHYVLDVFGIPVEC